MSNPTSSTPNDPTDHGHNPNSFDDGTANEAVPFLLNDDTAVDDVDPGCEYCLGGFIPLGTHPILGAVYQSCTGCRDRCPCCNGTGLFPANTLCTYCLADALAVLGYTPVFCHTYAGVTAVHPTGVTL